jgi:tripartite-type tricarboxylate transporter receptor subunit TctC
MRRRAFLIGAGSTGAASALAPGEARAEDPAAFPSRPITLIMPWAAGTGIDLWHRAMGEVVAAKLGQPVVVENRTGASGTAGPAVMAATGKPDGYVISHIPITIFRIPFTQKVTWDPIKDFSYIIHLSGFLFGVTVRADSPLKSFKDLIEFARANPGKLTYGSPGAGTSLHIGMEQIALKAGVRFTHVPFNQGSEAALLGGHIMCNSGGASWWPHLQAGTMRLLVIWTKSRNPRVPGVPTLEEEGFPFVFDSPFGIAGPRGIHPDIVKKLHDAFKIALGDPKPREIMTRYDYVERYMGSADYTRFVAEQVADQKATVERLGLAMKK